MEKLICEGDSAQCSQGSTPCQLKVVNNNYLMVGNKKVATVNDFSAMCLSGFGMCSSMANPSVATATAAANGVLTPQPCQPVITAPWSSSSVVSVNYLKAVTENSKTMCAYAGNITIMPNQKIVKG